MITSTRFCFACKKKESAYTNQHNNAKQCINAGCNILLISPNTQSQVMLICCYYFVLDRNFCVMSNHRVCVESLVDNSVLRNSTSGVLSTVTTTSRSTLRSWSN
ncbi:MAG: hypothetical protein ACKPKO_53810, partial [Candidatus Fonsibacter sp.]